MDRFIDSGGSTMTARLRFALSAALALGLCTSPPVLASTGAGLDGSWTGTLDVRQMRGAAAATSTLVQVGARVQGTVTFTGAVAAGTFAVTGSARRGHARLAGVLGSERWRWTPRWSRKRRAWRGVFRMRAGRRRMHGRLTMTPDDRNGPVVECGADYFAQALMPRVLEPICAQCHVAGGLAQSTRLRVTPGDPVATARTAIKLVDLADPAHSLLLLKPRAELAHGGGQRLVPGSPEEGILAQWITLVTSPECGRGNGGGGATGDPYVDNCASCHGPDARGLAGRPDIHCNRSIHDVVRTGRTGPAGEMPAFPTLSEADLATIQAFLLGLCPTTTVTGAELYASNCTSCHGSDARGVDGHPNIRCNRAIHDAVRNGRTGPAGSMPAFAGMSDAEVALVQDYLAGLCPPGTASGEDLYAGNCATCHGAEGGGVGDAPSIRCATRVADAVQVGRGARMASFPALVGADVGSLDGFLAGLCVQYGRTGADLWAGNCSTCHGVTANGGRNGLGVRGPEIQCTGANDFREKVQQGDDEMPAFPALGSGDVDAIVSFVHGSYCSGN